LPFETVTWEGFFQCSVAGIDLAFSGPDGPDSDRPPEAGMHDKRNAFVSERPAVEPADPRARVRTELARRGLPERVAETLTGKLASTVAKLSEEEVAAVLDSVAAAHGVRGEAALRSGIAEDDLADVQRLMQGFREEVQKLDEGLRVLSAYVSRLRKRGEEPLDETLH
jgi:hypothetical protein